jgi:ubiquinone biosynthesis protein UbiJ
MATQSPFPFLDDLFDRLSGSLQPPAWMVDEVQRRMVLLVNHVLMQEPEAQARLARQSGRVLQAQWRNFVVRLVATPAGLLDVAPLAVQPDLALTITETSALGLAQAALRGDKPPVTIAGDVQFAAEVNWLVDHVRWDLEEDLSRVIGDAPAHVIGDGVRGMVQTLRQFAGWRSANEPPAASGPGQAGA